MSGRKMLTAISANAGTSRSVGSLSIGAPDGMVTDDSPPKVSGWSDSGTIIAPSSVSATWTAPITRGVVPNSFERRTRIRCPPIVDRTIIRIVSFSNVCEGGALEN